MTDGAFPDRVVQLRSRWEADPTSRIFLQLAEEYRHLGRVKEALEVLEKGLKEHPGYLSALVAKGRCHIELGEPQLARAVLERVVKQDPTQMVANKLLVRACLETGEPERARERLELYSLLNDSDPEIEDLRRRIKAAERPAPAAAPPDLPDIEADIEADIETGAGDDDPFALGEAPSPPAADVFDFGQRPAPRRGGDVFDIDLTPAVPLHTARAEEDIFELADAAPPVAATTAPTASAEEPELKPLAVVPTSPEPFARETDETDETDETGGPEGGDGDLFPGLASRASRHRYLAALAEEGIFLFEAPAAPPPVAALPAPEPEPEPAPAPVEMPPPLAAGPAPFLSWADPAPFAELAEPPPAETFQDAESFQDAEPAFREETPLALERPWEPEEPLFEPAAPAPVAMEDLEPPVYIEPAVAGQEPAADDLEPAAAGPEPVAPTATVILGELYLRQGHPREAERIFTEILDREPDNAAAREGLERAGHAARERRPLDAAQLLQGFDPDRAEGGANARKLFLLDGYLQRIRWGRRRDVS
jgi:tetratricopeptide (TPR) repeat protein